MSEEKSGHSLLKAAYHPESFREQGHLLVDLLADYLTQAQKGDQIPVLNWHEPEKQFEFWEDYSGQSPDQLFKDILDRSIHLHHPGYVGHQIAPTLPLAAIANLQAALLNNGMAVYEMGSASTAIERKVVQIVNQALGYDEKSDGFLTSGGTLANLTALLTARSALSDRDFWNEGNSGQLAVMVSEDAHYCIDRAVKVMGLGKEGLIKVPVDQRHCLQVDQLHNLYQEAVDAGKTVFAVVGSACSTATGSYDDLEAMASFCEERGIWFHVDGAHGGAAVFSGKYRNLVAGISRADSIVIDAHKMMMAPSNTTFILLKDGRHSYQTFRQKAEYLLKKDEEWFNVAGRSFECTKHMMSIKVFAMLQQYGMELVEASVDQLYDLSRDFAGLIESHPNFRLALEPQANIVCFQYAPEGISEEGISALNAQIRERILKEGKFYLVQTVLKGQVHLRTTLMNPLTRIHHLKDLLEEIEKVAENIQP